MSRRFRNSAGNASRANHDFSRVPSVDIRRSVFDRSSTYKTAFDTGYLVPVFVDEALPGDTFHLETSALARLSTPIVPFMDDLSIEVQFFSVPYRLVWEHWQAFCGEKKNPGDSTDYQIPKMVVSSALQNGSIYDYFGLPTGVAGANYKFSELPLRAYNLIWNEWYRDENLQDSVKVPLGDSATTDFNDYKLLKRNKRHDYFTSCLPWPQKGDPVSLPINNPTISYDRAPTLEFSNGSVSGFSAVNGFLNRSSTAGSGTGFRVNASSFKSVSGLSPEQSIDAAKWKDLGITLSTSTSVTVNDLRYAFGVQRFLETNARSGSRYIEIIKGHFGVDSPDARLQRPEFLGQVRLDINVNPVLQTSASDSTTPQGNLAAFAAAAGSKRGFSHSFVEHCVIIGLASVRSVPTYQQGLNRMWSRSTLYDFYWPGLAHLGEQPVLNKEIYTDGSESDDKVFGYQERYAEYRYKPSMITGKLRSTDSQTLDVWHLAQKFTELPTLSSKFIEENIPMDRVLAVKDEPEVVADFFFKLKCVRPMPVYGVPGMGGRL